MDYELRVTTSNLHLSLYRHHAITVKEQCGEYPIKGLHASHVDSTVIPNVK